MQPTEPEDLQIESPREGEDSHVEEPVLLRPHHLVVVEGRKFPNTDALPTQPLRCIRRV